MTFTLHPSFLEKKLITELKLCAVFIENNAHYPWLILVPQRINAKKLMDLSKEDQALLLEEIDAAQKVLWELFSPSQLNVAALGNKTPQLHIHVIARYETDPAWPNAVWDHPAKKPYDIRELDKIANLIKNALLDKILLQDKA